MLEEGVIGNVARKQVCTSCPLSIPFHKRVEWVFQDAYRRPLSGIEGHYIKRSRRCVVSGMIPPSSGEIRV